MYPDQYKYESVRLGYLKLPSPKSHECETIGTNAGGNVKFTDRSGQPSTGNGANAALGFGFTYTST
jgi:hypothetical protein